MKIGILTAHYSHNYGAFLQAYALSNLLVENTGNCVEIIDFHMKKTNANKLPDLSGFSSAKATYVREKYQIFESNISNKMKKSSDKLISDNCDEFRQWIEDKYDIIIVGSDEMWHINSLGFPTPYWLPGDYGSRKMTYAISSRIDVSILNSEQKQQMADMISDFSYIGVRDQVTYNLVHSLTGIKASFNCDPTFAYDFCLNKELGRWLLRSRFGVDTKKKTIGLMVINDYFANQIIRKYKDDFNFISLYYFNDMLKRNATLTPFEWVQVIAGCDGLITTFYHAVIFALKGNTPFTAFEYRDIPSDEYSKIYDLLSRNGLDNRYHRLENSDEQSLRIGPFLADVLTGKERCDFTNVCEKEKKLFYPFLKQIPDIRPNHIVAIKLVNDEKGFWYPRVDEGICVNCGNCKAACAFCADKKEYGNRSLECGPLAVYGIKHKNEVVRMYSRSGGAFTAISDRILIDNDR